jgi:recombination protein RecT
MSDIQKHSGNGFTLQALLSQPAYKSRFNEVLGNRANQFVSSLIALSHGMKDVEPRSILASAMTAATLDLPIDKNLGFAWIVPYKDRGVKVAQFQMGYKGYVQLALRTGQYAALNVCEVYEGELVESNKLTGSLVIDPSKRTSDKVEGYASYLKLISGFEHAVFWTIDEVKRHAERYSQAYRYAIKSNQKDSPWVANFDEMAMKTVLADHIRKWGPMTIQLQVAATHDQSVKRGIEPEAQLEYPDNPDRPQIQGGDDVPMDFNAAQQETEKRVTETAASPSEANVIRRNEIAEFVISGGLTFDDFRESYKRTFCANDTQKAEVDAWPGFEAIPADALGILDARTLSKFIAAKRGSK